ncbi:MAG TPA: hypothetical protein VMU72_03345 [Gaiellaceae bacterium]|nr:hypothetical protein [Gaiellaceae bacterium]
MKRVSLLAAALVAAAITTAVAFGAAGTKTGGLPTIDVTMDGSSISVEGTLVSGAVDVHSVATGQGSGTPLFVRLNDGVTANQLIAFLSSKKAADANNVASYGSIVFDSNADPTGQDVETKLQPGDYVAFDATANNPAQWPNTTFSISLNNSPAKLPAAQQWQKSVEFRFRGPGTLHVGQTIRTSNSGWLVHMMIGAGVKNKAAGREVVKLLRAGKDNKIGKLASGGFFSFFGPVSHGAVQQFTLQAQPGWYVEACFMDTQDGREHTRLGMERLIHIVP